MHACCPHTSRFLRGDPQGLPSPWPWMGCGGEGPVWRGKRDSVTGSDGPPAAWGVCHVRSCREGYLKRQRHAELLCLLLRRKSKTLGAHLLTLSKYLTGLISSSVLKTLPPGSKDNLVIPRLPTSPHLLCRNRKASSLLSCPSFGREGNDGRSHTKTPPSCIFCERITTWVLRLISILTGSWNPS